jgi:hypothetical protein
LLKRDVLVFASGMDMGLHSKEGIESHKTGQAERFVKPITDQFHPNLVRQLQELKKNTEKLSGQLYSQAVVLNAVADRIIRLATLYYSQRVPSTLGSFKWYIDAKDPKKITTYESLWRDIVAPFLQTKSMSEPLEQLNGADYSSFNRFYRENTEVPAHLRPHVENPSEPFRSFYVSEVIREHLRFPKSDRYSGIQLADIIANAIRRACNGSLSEAGWANLGKLMVQSKKGTHSFQLLALGPGPTSVEAPYAGVVKKFDRDSKAMLLPD